MKSVSKVVSIQVTPAKSNESKHNEIISHLKHVILVESVLGINRLYLLEYKRFISLLYYVYRVCIALVVVYAMINNKTERASLKVIRDTSCIEYFILLVISIFTKKSSMRSIFQDMSKFDEALNIHSDLDITTPILRGWLWIALSASFCVLEYISLTMYVFENQPDFFILVIVTMMSHDCELVYFCLLIRAILMRVRVMRAHVAKLFLKEVKDKKKITLSEMLSNRVKLDIGELHKNYELMHKCAEKLNSLMSFPMMIMLFCSGVSATMLMKNLFKAFDTTGNQNVQRAIIAYSVIKCTKYTLLVVAPCYNSSVTTSQVSQIRTMLHDAMNRAQIDKMERRRVKAFFQLTRESEYAYALWGVIRLNMSLPLSYLSLCTTYLVIIIQFSKFID